MAFRKAGSVGRGGSGEDIFSPLRGGDMKMPEEGAGDRGHQRVTMKTSLGTTFEAVEVELFLSCLQRLCFDLKCAREAWFATQTYAEALKACLAARVTTFRGSPPTTFFSPA
jgi:hypothetical protein